MNVKDTKATIWVEVVWVRRDTKPLARAKTSSRVPPTEGDNAHKNHH
jgi:hypothetical protein